MKSRIMIFLIIFIALSGSAAAADLVSIDMPSEVDHLTPFQLKLVINDNNIIQYANKIVIEKPYGADFFFTRQGASEEKSHLLEFPYNGEKEIIFDVVPTSAESYQVETVSYIRFTFFGDPEVIKSKVPQAANIYSYRGDLGYAERNISVNPVSFNVNLPSVPGTIAKDDAAWVHAGSSAITFTYYDTKKDLRSYSGTFTKSICSNPSSGRKYCTNVDFFSSANTKQYNGEFSYNAWKGEYFTQSFRSYIDQAQGFEYLAVETRFVAQQGYVEYMAQIQKSKKIDIEDEESYVQETIKEMEAIAQSAVYRRVKSSGRIYSSVYYPKFTEEKQLQKEVKVFGTVANAENNPMPFMQIEITAGGKKFTGFTTKTGDFSIPLTGLDVAKETDVQVQLNMKYIRDGKHYFTVYHHNIGDDFQAGAVVDSIKLKPNTDSELHYVLDSNGLAGKNSFPDFENIKALSVIYYHMHEAVDFAITKLNANVDYKLPVEVLVGSHNDATKYSSEQSMIIIAEEDKDVTSTDRPMNREYHEFGHHVMFAEYGAKWPDGAYEVSMENHDGFINPNTADSFMEGFAEFYAMVVAQSVGRKNPEVYSIFGNLENNYKPWQAKGKQEEFAVAGILWDLYDSANDKGDSISLSMDDIWQVIKVKRANFYEYYQAFIDKYPDRAEKINEVFIEHGFFADKSVGNAKRDVFEPFRDANKNKAYDNGEFYVDYGCVNDETEIAFGKGDVLGKAANYQRADTRKQAGFIPDAFLKISDSRVRLYRISVLSAGASYSYDADLRQGLLYVHPLPDDFDAAITITPESKDYIAGQEFKITSKELTKKINEAKDGYFAEYDFKLKATGSNFDESPVYEKGEEPSYNLEDNIYGNNARYKLYETSFEGDKTVKGAQSDIKDNTSQTGKKGSLAWLWILIIIIVLCAAGYFLKDKIIPKKKHAKEKKS